MLVVGQVGQEVGGALVTKGVVGGITFSEGAVGCIVVGKRVGGISVIDITSDIIICNLCVMCECLSVVGDTVSLHELISTSITSCRPRSCCISNLNSSQISSDW